MKSLEGIKKIVVAGAGTMGSSIAQVCASTGFQTLLYDVDEKQLSQAEKNISANLVIAIQKGKITGDKKEKILSLLKFTSDFTELKADVVIEAIIEKLQPKQELFRKLSEINTTDTIFATNTSSIPITRIAAAVPYPERIVGMHFFTPAHIMKLVEVISGVSTEPQVALTIKSLAEKMEKLPVMVKDSPGFIVNRVARHFYVESLKTLEDGVAAFEDIDALMEATGFKMGPFRLMDLVGNDINFSVTSSLFESFHFESKFRPSRIQQQKVEAGNLGRKSGRGFYDYSK